MKYFSCKGVAIKLYNYFLKEKEREQYFHSISKPVKRAAHVLDISYKTLKRWISESEDSSEDKRETRGRPLTLDSFDKDLIGRAIVKMMADNEYVTLRTLSQFLKKNHDLNIRKNTLWRCVRSLGFRFKKTSSCNKVICESKNMSHLRAKYLRKLKELRSKDHDIIFLDESYINAHHTCAKEWQSKDCQRNIPSGKGKRLIIGHCGSYKQGLIDDGELLFESKSTDENGDYHKDMNYLEFQNWICNKVVPKLEPHSCIVMDNAAYHNVISPEDKVPTMAMRKDGMIAWLDKHDIDHSEARTKKELLEIVKESDASKVDVFRIDKFLIDSGHIPLRLPPYTPQLNPIELVWAELKSRVAEANTTFKLSDVMKHTSYNLKNISKEFWQKCEDHVRKVEDMYWEKDGLNIPMQGKVVINPFDTSSESESPISSSESE